MKYIKTKWIEYDTPQDFSNLKDIYPEEEFKKDMLEYQRRTDIELIWFYLLRQGILPNWSPKDFN